MMQTPLLHRLFLDLVSSSEHLLGSAKIDICRREIVQGLMVALVVVIIHKAGDLNFQLSGQEVILQVHYFTSYPAGQIAHYFKRDFITS